MRLLHTGDWHVGKQIRGRSRMDEFEAALDQVVGIAVEEGVDAVLVAGDLYEHRVPAPEADALVFDAFLRLRGAGIRVVAIPGNHDSAPRLEALARLLEPLGVSVVPTVRRPDRGGIVEVPSRDGSEVAQVACVPFVPERRFGDARALFEAAESWHQAYAEGMGDLLGAMAAGFRPGAVHVLMAHLFTDGALLGGGERELTIGMAYAVSPSRLPGTAQYVALGHVHRPQRVRGAPTAARYAGSLLQLDFGELTQEAKSVSVVEATPGKPAKVREVPITAGRRLLEVRGTLDELQTMADEVGDAWLRARVRTEGPVPGLADRVREALPNALDVVLEYERAPDEGPREPLRAMSPREQFEAFLRHEHGAEPAPELLEAFDEVLALETEEA
ncbi:MAG TPA: exonuclease SbcCD subunit D [Actinomycetota bacterium]|nr:exonuclease SbcCD subunit D [Actinomycetota bacterium]